MGKRSDFERKPRDFYPTPPEAVAPLLPHLPGEFSFCEPCAGNGALTDAIRCRTNLMSSCAAEYDIAPEKGGIQKADALTITLDDLNGADLIITNPPWDIKILHPMIEHFSAIRPTWLLFYADWMHTKQSAPYMPWLRKVVSVGRVKWIPDSKMTGKDNCAWHLFDQTGMYTGETVFHGRVAS